MDYCIPAVGIEHAVCVQEKMLIVIKFKNDILDIVSKLRDAFDKKDFEKGKIENIFSFF